MDSYCPKLSLLPAHLVLIITFCGYLSGLCSCKMHLEVGTALFNFVVGVCRMDDIDFVNGFELLGEAGRGRLSPAPVSPQDIYVLCLPFTDPCR